MKLGTLDIKKAYFGSRELTSDNAFIGTIPLIEGSPAPTIEMVDLGLTSGTLGEN